MRAERRGRGDCRKDITRRVRRMLGSKSDGGLVASAVQDVNEVHLIVVVVEENPVLAERETGARRLVSMFDGADAGRVASRMQTADSSITKSRRAASPKRSSI
jgi:hypothetical protein